MSEYTFFWANKSPFSQWYPSKFTDFNGVGFSRAEQYMMYAKAIMFGDDCVAKKILETTEPWEQKNLGRQVSGFDFTIWNAHCREIVTVGNYFKFTQNEKLKKTLLLTGDTLLVEASPYDRIWGIGFDEQHALANIERWGTNYLGQCLVEVRYMIREGREPKNLDPIKEFRK